ncbi:MAG: lamin tail domain-containing protein [Myxococcota bacterium]
MRSLKLLALFFSATGCFSPSSFDAPDSATVDTAPSPFRVDEWSIGDRHGDVWPLDNAPLRPVVTLEFNREFDADTADAIVLLEATALDDEELRADLRRTPVRESHRRRAVPFEIYVEGSRVELTPATLNTGARYVVGVGTWANDLGGVALTEPLVAAFQVGEREVGAHARASWPPDGMAGVPLALRFVAVRFDDVVEGIEGITLEGPAGVVRTDNDRVACRDVGWPSGTCVRLSFEGVLEPRRAYRVSVGDRVRDRGGAPVGPWNVGFETGDQLHDDLDLLEEPCAMDEYATHGLCALADDTSIRIRGRASGPGLVVVEAGTRRLSTLAPRGEFSLRVDELPPETPVAARLSLEGLSGSMLSVELPLETLPPLAPITIAEVRADPRGPEPRQEYVELINSGAVPWSLEGMTLADRGDREGDTFGPGPLVPAGGRVLVVATPFDPDHPDDPAVPAGIPLIRVDGSLASGGLSNAGEPLFLRNASGHRLSSFPALPAPDPGVCWVRQGLGRADDATDFFAAPCTPGRETPPP